MTVEEFLDWSAAEPTGQRWQLIDGMPEAMAPTTQAHGAIQAELARLIGNHLLARNSPCRVVTAPGVIPNVRAGANFRIPDLGVTCVPPENVRELRDPILLIEVLSPSNEPETRSNVWSYAAIPTVQEILLTSSLAVEGELLRRQPDGAWPRQAEPLRADDVLELRSIGLSMPMRAPYRTTALA